MKQHSIIILFVILLLVWLFRGIWLPELPEALTGDLLAWVEDWGPVIQTMDSLLAIVAFIITLAEGGYFISTYLLKPDEKIEILYEIAPDNIREILIGHGGSVMRVDRGATSPEHLQTHGKILLTGPSSMGKTREAVELICDAAALDLVNGQTIYRPAPDFHILPVETILSKLNIKLDRDARVLLFLDNLHEYKGTKLDDLQQVIFEFDRCKRAYVIAAARNEYLTPEHDKWLERNDFYKISLQPLTDEKSEELVDNVVGYYDMSVDDEAKQILVEKASGLPGLIFITLSRLYLQGVTQIDANSAEFASKTSITAAWKETRRNEIEKNHPGAKYILDALAHHYTTGTIAYQTLTLPFANHLWRQTEQLVFRRSRKLKQALVYLEYFGIVIQNDVIFYRDEIGEGVYNFDEATSRLGFFLVNYRRLFQRRWLRQLYRNRNTHWSVLFGLAFFE